MSAFRPCWYQRCKDGWVMVLANGEAEWDHCPICDGTGKAPPPPPDPTDEPSTPPKETAHA